jgi:hypothetical protein
MLIPTYLIVAAQASHKKFWPKGFLAAITALTSLCLSHHAEAAGRSAPSIYSAEWSGGVPGRNWGGDIVAEAARYVGEGKFTALPGAWCADAVSVWLKATGRPPLANRMAGAALSYGPRGNGAPGDLAVFMGRRGAYHVGVVVASLGDRVEVVSGNWGHRVGRAVASRRSLIFVRT